LQEGKNDDIKEPMLDREFCILVIMLCFYNGGYSTNIIMFAKKNRIQFLIFIKTLLIVYFNANIKIMAQYNNYYNDTNYKKESN
jgi:hypothetical protein